MKRFTLNKHISNVNNVFETLMNTMIAYERLNISTDHAQCFQLENIIQPVCQFQLFQYISDLTYCVQKQIPLTRLLSMIEGDFHSLTGHNMRAAAISVYIAAYLNGSNEDQKIAGLGALLHDTGKLGIPKSILDKPSYLTEEEFKVIKTHSMLGYNLLKNETWLPKESLRMVHNHHERLDGSGYPDGIHSKDLSIFDRIIAIADVFDAITSKRNYRPSLTYEEALAHIEKECPEKLDESVFRTLQTLILKDSYLLHLAPITPFSLKRMTYASNNG